MVTWSTCALVALVSFAVGAGMAFGVLAVVGWQHRKRDAMRAAALAELAARQQKATKEFTDAIQRMAEQAIKDALTEIQGQADGSGKEH